MVAQQLHCHMLKNDTPVVQPLRTASQSNHQHDQSSTIVGRRLKTSQDEHMSCRRLNKKNIESEKRAARELGVSWIGWSEDVRYMLQTSGDPQTNIESKARSHWVQEPGNAWHSKDFSRTTISVQDARLAAPGSRKSTTSKTAMKAPTLATASPYSTTPSATKAHASSRPSCPG